MLTKAGTGTFTLANTSTTAAGGNLAATGGTLVADYSGRSSSNMIGSGSTLYLGAATFSVNGNSGTGITQAFGNLELVEGAQWFKSRTPRTA